MATAVTGLESPNWIYGSQVGPFVDSNGNLYVVGEDDTTANDVAVSKSTNGGSTWVKQDTGNQPGASASTYILFNLSAYQVGDTIHVAACYRENATDPLIDVEYHTFRMSDHASDDTWGITNEAVEGGIQGPRGDTGQGRRTCAIGLRSDGDILLAYQGGEDIASTIYDRIYLRIKAASWAARTQLDAGSTNNYTGVGLAMGASDFAHIAWSEADDIYGKTVEDDDTVSSVVTISTARPGGGVQPVRSGVSWDNAGTQQIEFEFDDNDGGNSTRRLKENSTTGYMEADLSAESLIDSGNVIFGAALAVDAVNGVVYGVGANAANTVVHYVSGTNGTSFNSSTPTTIEGSLAGFYGMCANVYVRSGSRYLAVCYATNHDSAVYFEEVFIEVVPGPTAPPIPHHWANPLVRM